MAKIVDEGRSDIKIFLPMKPSDFRVSYQSQLPGLMRNFLGITSQQPGVERCLHVLLTTELSDLQKLMETEDIHRLSWLQDTWDPEGASTTHLSWLQRSSEVERQQETTTSESAASAMTTSSALAFSRSLPERPATTSRHDVHIQSFGFFGESDSTTTPPGSIFSGYLTTNTTSTSLTSPSEIGHLSASSRSRPNNSDEYLRLLEGIRLAARGSQGPSASAPRPYFCIDPDAAFGYDYPSFNYNAKIGAAGELFVRFFYGSLELVGVD